MRAKTNNQDNRPIARGGMTVDEFLSRLDAVSKQGNSWVARCPAHDDGRPSLKIREGDRGIMVNCWAGCHFSEIVGALDINPSMMFYDALDQDQIRERKAKNLRQQIQKIETRIYMGQQLMDAGTITDDERKALRNYIAEKIDLQRELHETEKV